MNKLIVLITGVLLLSTVELRAQNKPVIDSLEQLLKNSKMDTLRVFLYNQLAWEYRNSNTDITDSFTNLAIELGNKIGFSNGTGKAYINKAIVYRNKAEYAKAIEACRWALVQFLLNNNRTGYASAYNTIASVHYLMGNYSIAQFYFFESHKISEELHDLKGMGRTYLNLGSVLFEQKKYEKALKYYNKALLVSQELVDSPNIAICWNNIANVYQLTGNYDTSIYYYKQSVEVNQKVGDLKSMVISLGNIASIYSAQKNHREAINYYHQALTIDEKIGNINSIIIINANISDDYVHLGMYHAAYIYAKRSLDLALKYNMKRDIMQAYAMLYQTEEGRANFKEAFKYHKLYKQYSDSIYNEEASTKVNELEEQYLNERIEKQKILAQKEEEIQMVRAEEKEHAVTQYIFIIGLVLIIFVSFVYIVFFLLRRTKYS